MCCSPCRRDGAISPGVVSACGGTRRASPFPGQQPDSSRSQACRGAHVAGQLQGSYTLPHFPIFFLVLDHTRLPQCRTRLQRQLARPEQLHHTLAQKMRRINEPAPSGKD